MKSFSKGDGASTIQVTQQQFYLLVLVTSFSLPSLTLNQRNRESRYDNAARQRFRAGDRVGLPRWGIHACLQMEASSG